MAQWLGRWIRDQKVASSTTGQSTKSNISGQVVHTHVPLSPSSIIWYRPKGGDALSGKGTVGLASYAT